MPNWTPQKKLSSKIKWGFKVDPHDPQRIIPIPDMEKLMDQAFKYLYSGQYSLRDVAAWLSDASKINLSHIALSNHFKKHNRKLWRDRQRAAAAKKETTDSRIRTAQEPVPEGSGATSEGGSEEQGLAR